MTEFVDHFLRRVALFQGSGDKTRATSGKAVTLRGPTVIFRLRVGTSPPRQFKALGSCG